jgi:cobalamin biosynthesis Mg chelatase CobN
MMKPPEPDLGVDEGAEELDAGWDDPIQGSAPPPRPSGVNVAVPAAAPVAMAGAADDIDGGWDDGENDAGREEDAAVPAASAPLRAEPGPARRTLSKKERRELERKNRAHATQKSAEQKQSRRTTRREEARRLAEERQRERLEAAAAAQKQARQERRVREKVRSRRKAETTEPASAPAASAGTKRSGKQSSRTRGRPQKNTGGGWIVGLIALLALAAGLYAWSKR